MFLILPLMICFSIGTSRDVGLVGLRADLAETDTVLVEAEDAVAAALERPFCERLDRQEDRRVDALQGARQDVRAEERLVCVDTDPPHLLLTGRIERTETAPAGDLEDDPRTVRDLREGQLLALGLVVPVLRVRPVHLDAGHGLQGAGLVAGDVAVDRWLLEPADGADRLARRGASPRAPEIADDVADLLLLEQETDDVLRLALEIALVDVDDREMRIRKPLRRGGDRVALGEADADDQVVALARERDHVRDVLGGRRRLDDAALDPEIVLRTLEPLVRELVEPVVVELTLIGDEPDLHGLRGRRARMTGREPGDRRDAAPAPRPRESPRLSCSSSVPFASFSL